MPREVWVVIEGILVDHEAAENMLKCTRQYRPLEAGGLVLGLRKGLYLHVTEITRPLPWDRQSSTRFQRSPKGHRIAALRRWRKSGGKMIFPIFYVRETTFCLQFSGDRGKVLLRQVEKDELGTFYLTPAAIKRRLRKTGNEAYGPTVELP